MKLWEKYIEEREGAKIIYNDHGFLTYLPMEENAVLIQDVFVEKEYRKKGIVNQLWNRLIEQTKPRMTYGMTDQESLNWEDSHSFMISFGFTPYEQLNTMIYYYKEIE
jgi:predicted GNAT family acetyltransferase